MGGFNTHFVIDENDEAAVQSFTHPDQPNWITAHAIVTELSIAEVERLWLRFQQLGCNADGVLTAEALASPGLSGDVFVKNTIKNFKSPSGNISFESYLRGMKWCEVQDLSMKSRAIFRLLNNGNAIGKEILGRIMKRVYPDKSEVEVTKATEVLFNSLASLDREGGGLVTEEGFVKGVLQLPRKKAESLLDFFILPEEFRERVHDNLPEFSGSRVGSRMYGTPGPNYGAPPSQIPSDSLLRDVAERIQKRDWEMVANKLGFLGEDTENYRQSYPNSTSQQVYQMLKDWKSREGTNAKGKVLEKALRETGMGDAALLLAP